MQGPLWSGPRETATQLQVLRLAQWFASRQAAESPADLVRRLGPCASGGGGGAPGGKAPPRKPAEETQPTPGRLQNTSHDGGEVPLCHIHLSWLMGNFPPRETKPSTWRGWRARLRGGGNSEPPAPPEADGWRVCNEPFPPTPQLSTLWQHMGTSIWNPLKDTEPGPGPQGRGGGGQEPLHLGLCRDLPSAADLSA